MLAKSGVSETVGKRLVSSSGAKNVSLAQDLCPCEQAQSRRMGDEEAESFATAPDEDDEIIDYDLSSAVICMDCSIDVAVLPREVRSAEKFTTRSSD